MCQSAESWWKLIGLHIVADEGGATMDNNEFELDKAKV